MTHAILDRASGTEQGAGFCRAVVEEVSPSDGSARVRLDRDDRPEVDATLALSGGSRPAGGDRVLVAHGTDESFVIAVLERASGDPAPTCHRLTDGSTVRVEGEGAEERMRLRSPRDELLVEYDPGAGRLRLNAAAGDLELCSAAGDIVLNAGGTLRLAGSAIAVSSRRARLDVERTDVTGDEVRVRLGTLRLVVRRIERVADRVYETADRVFRTVRETLQLRAGRVRSIVRATYHLKARKAFLKSDEDFKVKGDQIHLG